MATNYALVMAGGQGTRFWPESVAAKPKQYLRLVGQESLLTQSLKRFGKSIKPQNRYIVTVESQAVLAREHATGEIADDGIILEPAGRNTAPCILLSLVYLEAQGAKDDDVVAIVPADHVILNQTAFAECIEHSCRQAKEHSAIITIGIPPHFPHTGYGYIQRGSQVSSNFFKVSSFKEKPSKEIAIEYLQSGNYLWNAGMFVVPLGVLRQQFATYAPEIFAFYNKLKLAIKDQHTLAEIYQEMPKDSIDYAIMEKSQEVLVTPAPFDWNDLGAWDALESVLSQQDNNTVVKVGNYYFEDATGNIIFAPEKFVAAIGVQDLIIADTQDALLIMPKSEAQRVKGVVNYLTKQTWGNKLL